MPLFAWVGALCAIAALGLLVLVLAIRGARSERAAQLAKDDAAQSLPLPPADGPRDPAKALRPEEPARPDPEVNEPWDPTPDRGVPVARTEVDVEVDAVGDSRFSATFRLPPQVHKTFKHLVSRPYLEGGVLKWREPKMVNVLRALDLESAGSLLEGLDGSYDADAIRVRGREVGWAKQRNGHWVNSLTTERKNRYRITRKTYRDGVPVVTLRCLVNSAGFQEVVQVQATLPHGAHDIRVENEPNQLVYRASPPAKGGGGRPSFNLQTKPHVMSALYKLYGDRRFQKLWVARGLFRNAGEETLTDYRVRFRLGGYSEWSRWETCDVVHPGQTVVDPFYPVIDARVRELHAPTPVDVQVEYSYVRPGGEKVSDTYSERTRLLGMNEGVFSDIEVDRDSSWYEMFKDAPLVLASFTSANDPAILDVVGLLGHATGGTGTSLNDREAVIFLRALYDLMRANIKYETTPGNRIDGLLHQHLKYGRDVLRSKSGTCVNTAIFYASVVEAAGLDALIFVIKGHAFAGARLPDSGKLVLVETTKATRKGGEAFEAAVASASKTYAEATALGLILPVDIRLQRQRGVTPPELPDVGKDPLREWGIVKAGGAGGPVPGPEPAPGPAPEEKTAAEFFQEGKGHAEQKKWAKAADCFTKAIEQDGTVSEYYSSRANAFVGLADDARKGGDGETAAGWFKKALDDLEQALKLDPANSKAWNNGGVVCNRLGLHREAIRYYTRAIEVDPDNAQAYRNRGITYGKLGDRSRSQADLERARELEN
jgi:tetratricopeptide (TPR) repeat protein